MAAVVGEQDRDPSRPGRAGTVARWRRAAGTPANSIAADEIRRARARDQWSPAVLPV
jgi:hypothetical protein